MALNLEEIATRMAQGLQVELKSVDAGGAVLEGRNATLKVVPFFGGWQIDVRLPDRPVYQFFEEDIRMLVQRVDARLKHYVKELEEAEQQQQQKRRPGR